MKYKGFEVDDNKIDDYVERLEISIAEACDLILEESGKLEETAEEKAVMDTKTARRYEKSEKPRKKTVKERKVDETKGHLLQCTKTLLEGLGAVNVTTKTETEIHFTFEGAEYTYKLTKHRPPKK